MTEDNQSSDNEKDMDFETLVVHVERLSEMCEEMAKRIESIEHALRQHKHIQDGTAYLPL